MARARIVSWCWLLCSVLGLAGCTTLGLWSGTAPAPKTLDLAHDQVATLVFVLDLPDGLEPVPGATTLRIDTPSGPVTTGLALADAQSFAARLPPLETGHSYYFMGVPDTGKASLEAAQATVRGASGLPLFVSPALCARTDFTPSGARVAVLAVGPDGIPFAPLTPSEPLQTLLTTSGVPPLTACTR